MGGEDVRILITGGAGFVGSNLSRALVGLGHNVVVFDDFSTGLISNLDGAGVDSVSGTIEDMSSLKFAAKNCDVIVHLAARGSVPRSISDPRATHSVNATGTLNVLEVARSLDAKVIFSSSSSVYGANESIPKVEKMWTSPLSPYAGSKLAGEGYCSAYSESYGVRVATFRFFNIFGPRQRPDHAYAAVIPKWIWAVINGDPIELDGDGTQTRDFTYVSDVVGVINETIVREITHPQPVNLAFGNRVSLLEVISELESIVGKKLQVQWKPKRISDVLHSQNNPALMNSLYPNTDRTDFSTALKTTFAWFKETNQSRP